MNDDGVVNGDIVTSHTWTNLLTELHVYLYAEKWIPIAFYKFLTKRSSRESFFFAYTSGYYE